MTVAVMLSDFFTTYSLSILLSSCGVFLASDFVHWILNYHKNDWKKLENEDETISAVRSLNIPPGDYMVPCSVQMWNEEWKRKAKEGPYFLLRMHERGRLNFGRTMLYWFICCVTVGLVASILAYDVGIVKGTHSFFKVFRFFWISASFGYGLGHLHSSIFLKRSWWVTSFYVLDGIIYGFVTAVVFGFFIRK